MTTQQQPIDNRDILREMFLTLVVEERRAILTRLTMYNAIIAKLKPEKRHDDDRRTDAHP